MEKQNQIGSAWKLRLSAAYYTFHRISPIPIRNNATRADGGFASEFRDLDIIIAITYEGWKWPASLLFDYAHNFGAAPGIGDDLYWVEASLGRIDQVGSWQFKYEATRIQQDAVLADFNQDDTFPETRTIRHGLYGTVRVFDRGDLNLTYYLFRANGSPTLTDEPRWTSRVRLNLTTQL